MSAGKDRQHGKRRASRSLPLMLVTSAALTACSSSDSDSNQELTAIRDQYKSLEDCRKDWGDGPACESVATSNLNTNANLNSSDTTGTNTGNGYTGSSYAGTGGHYNGYTMHYFGPHYSPGSRETVQRSFGFQGGSSDHAVSRSTSTSRGSVSRGGFGGTSHGSSGGG
ncbi:hypothetical protein ACO0LM_18115 [Undibacterium sp. Di26W]|uniref:hypothetical protein n=1 Tax=Undibacterium sp. Di26W TaxID=3413035 RepID=UPI003BF381A7